MSEAVNEQSLDDIFHKVDQVVLKPVDSSLINLASTSSETISLIKRSSLSFTATDLLNITSPDLLLLSKRVRSLFTKTASMNGVKIDKNDLEQIKDDNLNPLAHEVDHLKKVKELRPELIQNSSVNIMAVLHNNQLKIGINVMIPTPNEEYSVIEKALIQIAPNLPSDSDYYNLMVYLKGHLLSNEDVKKIEEMVGQKRKGPGKDNFLGYLQNR